MTTPTSNEPYPLRLEIDYSQELSRVSILFRVFWLIPTFIVAAAIGGATGGGSGDTNGFALGAAGGGGGLFFGVFLMILFRQKYPKWWFDWNLQISRFTTRIWAAIALLTDQYPSTDEEQSVHLDIDYPDAKDGLNRWLPLVKWFLAIPHYVVLFFLGIAVFVVNVIAWVAILFTGRYPRGLFVFVVSWTRWISRVWAYAVLLVTDRYPPFSMDP